MKECNYCKSNNIREKFRSVGSESYILFSSPEFYYECLDCDMKQHDDHTWFMTQAFIKFVDNGAKRYDKN